MSLLKRLFLAAVVAVALFTLPGFSGSSQVESRETGEPVGIGKNNELPEIVRAGFAPSYLEYLGVSEATADESPREKNLPPDDSIAIVTHANGRPVVELSSANQSTQVLKFDVAEAGTRFVFDEAPVFEDGYPAYGNPFITEGYLYPPGTLSETNGVLPDGSPEFPELVVGQWVCRGFFIGDGAHTTTGPWVVTTQIFDLGSEPGRKMIITEGFEDSRIGHKTVRAISAGTGRYSNASGRMTQTLTGFNETMGVNLHVTLRVNR